MVKTYFEDDPELSLETDCPLPRHKVEQLGDMLTSILVYDPQDRPSAAQLLDHPFFADNPCEHDEVSGWTK